MFSYTHKTYWHFICQDKICILAQVLTEKGLEI